MTTTIGKTFVIKLGGSFLLAGGAPNTSAINGMASTVKSIADDGHKLVVVTRPHSFPSLPSFPSI